MRFCPWYPLAAAAAHAPEGEGVLQLRVADGLVDYPRGKSAMVYYEHAQNVRTAAVALAAARDGQGLLCRHLEPEDREAVNFAEIHAKLLAEFIRRFGVAPGDVR